MKEIKMTTFISNKEQLDIALKNNVSSILIEHPYFSLRSFLPSLAPTDFLELEKIISIVRQTNKNIKIIFNLDLLAHNEDLPFIEKLLDFLESKSVNTIRIQEIGLASFVALKKPSFHIQFSPEIGINNEYSLQFCQEGLKGKIELFVAPSEISYKDVGRLQIKTNIPVEIYAHGPILIQYSARKVLTASKINKSYVLACEEKRQEDVFPFLQNEHGTFMYHSKEKDILPFIPQLFETNASSILIDCRNKEISYFDQVLSLYNNGIKNYFLNPIAYENKKCSFFFDLKPNYYTQGFFLKNTTDQGLSSSKETKEEMTLEYVGEVLDSIKENVIAIETKISFKKGDHLLFINPNKKQITIKVNKIMDFTLEEIEKAKPEKINVIGWHKGIISRALVYKMPC